MDNYEMRMVRLKAEISQRDLANELGLSQQEMSDLERQKTEIDDETRKAYLEALSRIASRRLHELRSLQDVDRPNA